MNPYRPHAAAAAIALTLPQRSLAFKAIYASAVPVPGVEAQYGGSHGRSETTFHCHSALCRTSSWYNALPALKRTGLF